MSNLNSRFSYGLRRIGVAAAASLLVALPGVLLAEDAKLPPRLVGDKPLTPETLFDRIQIEDLLTRYYYDLSAARRTSCPITSPRMRCWTSTAPSHEVMRRSRSCTSGRKGRRRPQPRPRSAAAATCC
ncbi:MAG: hypothetical protein WDO56_19035 [Gammaproteobacteria bacterium]